MQTLTLTHGRQRLEAAPWRGGLAFSYQVDGEEVLYLDRATFDDPAKSVRGGIPVLFPWAGPLPEGTFGTSGPLPQHGLARQAVWELMGEELVHRSSAVFPWSYEVRLRFSLTDEGLRLETSVTNHDSREMPVQLGFHPYFAVEDKATLSFELPASTYRDNDEEGRPDHAFPGKLPLTERGVDWELRDLSERRCAMVGRRRLELRWSERFPVLVVWSLLDKPFVCLEPWTAGRFAQATGDPDLWRVAPGATESAWWSMQVS